MRISDWSSDVCSSDLRHVQVGRRQNTMIVEDVAMFGAQAGKLENPGQEIDRYQVEYVHEDDPQEDRERQRRHKMRSEERHVGKEWFSTCRSRWSPDP